MGSSAVILTRDARPSALEVQVAERLRATHKHVRFVRVRHGRESELEPCDAVVSLYPELLAPYPEQKRESIAPPRTAAPAPTPPVDPGTLPVRRTAKAPRKVPSGASRAKK